VSGGTAIVIGAGFGGLAAAARLASRGRRVTLFDKREDLGGRGMPFEKAGFRFDSGPTVITAPYLFDDIWRLSGRDRRDYFELRPLDPFYRIFDHTGRHVDYRHRIDDMLREVERISPADRDGFMRMTAHTRRVFERLHPSTDQPFHRLSAMLAIVPDVLKMGLVQDMYGYASRFIRDPFLRQVFSFHPLLVGGNPFDTPSIYALIVQFEREWGVHYPTGGTGAIVRGFERLLGELGADVHLGTEVSEILLEGRRAVGVRLSDGSEHRADTVVCNADAAWAYQHLIPAARRRPTTTARLRTMAYSNSLFVIYFGTRRRYLDSRLAHHNIIIGPEYRRQLRDIFGARGLPEHLSLYLHMPTRTDETIAPSGCESFYVLALVPNLDAGVDWATRAQPLRDRIVRYLEERYLPDLEANIVVEHRIDPRHFATTLNSHKGAAFAAKPTLLQSAWLRPHTKSGEFDGLYFVGASTHPGAGVPAVIASGKIAADLILAGDDRVATERVPAVGGAHA
jgi:phytoene desaturase